MEDVLNLTTLGESIKVNGQREAIVLLDGQVLDGNNRQRACEIAKVTPIYREFGSLPTDGDSPAHFVKDKNWHRRHLTIGQKASAAEEFFAAFEAEAAAAAGTTTKESTKVVAAQFGTSPRSVERARAVKKADPKAFADVKAGTKTLAAAEKEIKDDKQQAAAATQAATEANELAAMKAERKKNTKKLNTLLGEAFGTAYENGVILKTRSEHDKFLALPADDQVAIAELIILKWTVDAALKFIQKTLDSRDSIGNLILLAAALDKGKKTNKAFKTVINGWAITARRVVEGAD